MALRLPHHPTRARSRSATSPTARGRGHPDRTVAVRGRTDTGGSSPRFAVTAVVGTLNRPARWHVPA
ncbi:hypothetical protein [Micromonospora sp. NPDC049497]|uniref:hypothetical protein n=1 Tax=Micromonospora sp. NPDC049497 TaxID=3364273 RepID=UPI00378B9EF5